MASAENRAMFFEIDRRTADGLQIAGRFQSRPTSKVIARRQPDVRQMPIRFVQDCLPTDVAAHPTSIVFPSLKCDRHARPDQKSADHAWPSVNSSGGVDREPIGSMCVSVAHIIIQSKKISNDQELIQSDPTSCPQNQKGNN